MKTHLRKRTSPYLALWAVVALSWLFLSACHKHDHDEKCKPHTRSSAHKQGPTAKTSAHKEDHHDEHKGKGKHKDHNDDEHKGGHGHKDGDKDHHKGGHKDHHDEPAGEVVINADAMKRIKLEYAVAQVKSLPTHHIAAVGRVVLPPARSSRVGSRVEGRIVRWLVNLGQSVRQGQPIALLDSPAVGLARANYLRRQALHRLAKIEYQRNQQLKKIGLASAKQLLASYTALQRAQIDLQSAHAQLRILGISVPSAKTADRINGRLTLRAPASGEVTDIPYALGSWVQPQTTILRIEDRRQVWVLLEVYARDVPYIRKNQLVHLYGPGIHRHLEGHISYLANRFERGAQTLEARVVLENPKGSLRPNQFLYALFRGESSSKPGAPKRTTLKALALPEDAVQRMGQRKVVFVVGKKSGHFQVRTVVVIEAPEGWVRILYGLKAGEKVVSQGSFLLKSVLLQASLDGGHGHAH